MIASRASSPAGVSSALARARQTNDASTSKLVARPRRCGGRAPLSAATSPGLKEKVRMTMSPRAPTDGAAGGAAAKSLYSRRWNASLGGLRASRSSRDHAGETAGSRAPRARSATASMNCTIPEASHMAWLRRIPRTNPPQRRRVTCSSTDQVNTWTSYLDQQ
ncbi:Os07g0244250 [Oryza sativa Japonica Group]|uniref:Os07g0244250 protein n=1 Tax=Oryza sativa subsp. japonica TaxID=39947 RepID=A0A0P0X4P7_ORYSJ|nr:hypothetical protein EE612_038148 [Oryza sativa]BAT00796.1 Os07g0244250 [Oryza sativa Japonica Group]